MQSSSQSSQSASYPPTAIYCTEGATYVEGSHDLSGAEANAVSSLRKQHIEKIVSLVHILLVKYGSKQIVTMAEMLAKITGAHELSYHVVVTKASDCMWLLFGIDIVEVYPLSTPTILSLHCGSPMMGAAWRSRHPQDRPSSQC